MEILLTGFIGRFYLRYKAIKRRSLLVQATVVYARRCASKGIPGIQKVARNGKINKNGRADRDGWVYNFPSSVRAD